MIDHNYRSLYRHPNSRSIVGFNLNVWVYFKCSLKPFTSLSNRFIDYLQGLYTRGSAFEVSFTRVIVSLGAARLHVLQIAC